MDVSFSCRDLAARTHSGQLRPSEAVQAALARIDSRNAALNAVVGDRGGPARAEARALDDGPPVGALHGVPLLLKDSLDLAGTPSTGGFPSRRGHVAPSDVEAVARLRAAGGVFVGKTNVAQALLFFETDNPLFGRTSHPDDPTRSPGGSSGGLAAGIAAGIAPMGLGTDLGGSCRVPAAFCGVVGFKPGEGRMDDPGEVSVTPGQLAIRSQIGVLGRTVDDVRLGYALAAATEVPERPLRRVGVWVEDGLFTPCAAAVRAVEEAAAALAADGVEVVRLDPPEMPLALRTFYGLLASDGLEHLFAQFPDDPFDARVRGLRVLSRLADWLPTLGGLLLRASGRGATADLLPELRRRTVAEHWTLVERQQAVRRAWADRTAGLDAVLSPAVALPAIRHGASLELGTMGVYTCLYNLLGWPAGVVPWTRVRPGEETAARRGDDVVDRVARASEEGSAGLPIGVQLAAPIGQDAAVLAAMAAVERRRPT